MTTRVVHRPTRTTVPVARPAAQPLAPPPALESDQASGPMPLQFLMPVMGATTSVVMMVVLRNGQPLFLVVAGLVFVVALVGGLGFALSARGRAGRVERVRRRKYLDYLEHLRRDLATRGTDDRTQVVVAHPEPAALVGLVADPTRLWERRRGNEDYLTTRVGVGAVDWFDLSVPPPESPVAPHDPYLLAEAELVVAQHSAVAGMPVTVDLVGASVVAVIGPRDAAVALVRAMVAQLACHHGPDDLVLAAWFSPEHATDWAGLDLLPHVEDATLFDGPVLARRVGRDPAELRQVLGTTLADRVSYAHAARRTSTPLPAPARLVIVADDDTVPARRAVSGVDVSPAAMGITVIHVLADRLDEPDDVDIRIELAPHGRGATVTTAPGRAGQRTVEVAADLMDSALFVATARSLAPLRLSAAVAAPGEETVPDSDELLGFSDPANLAHWGPREPEDFLRVPFAHDDHGDPVWLDLKESAQLGMGPHGLCVGATGSGKSELLRTLVVSLVTTHPPEDLAMILVDYKGGAAFAPFAGLPHLAGLIDNLADDPHLTTRARASISGEVVRRQRMLKDAGSLPSIGAYRTARTTDPDLPAMPHLLVVIDEFGELLTAEPEFTDLFLQIGRIGRSIGVHLLLASQRLEAGKLRGLDTYLSYRLGLRTFSEAESQMVLDSSDAYRLPALPGYGYLKVDTSVYTRFRSGYVSGPIRHDAAPPPEVAAIRTAVLGPYNGLRRDPARPDRPVELRRANTGPTVVDTVVAQLKDPERGVVPVAEVWLPPLPDRLAVGSLVEAERAQLAGGLRSDLGAVLGLVDDPAAQSQGPWWLDLTRSGGHVAFVGAPGSGRTTALRTLAVSLALTRTPTEVAVYGLDLTGGGLARLEHFPHVGGVASRTDQDKVVRLLEELGAMLHAREAVVRSSSVESMTHLRSLHRAGKLPELAAADVVVLVDGYGQLRTDFPQLDDAVATLLTRGPSFGIHLVMRMNRWSDLRMAHQTLIGTRVEMRLGDAGDSTIDRKLAKTLSPDTPGRVLTDDARFAQIALPVLELVDDDHVGEALEALAARVAAAWTGPSAAPIRLLPTELALDSLPDAFDAPDAVPLGVRQDTMDTAWWDLLGDDQHLLVLGDTRCGKTAVLRAIVAGLTSRWSPDELAIAVVDSRGHAAPAVPEDYLAAHAKTAPQAAALVRSIAAELDERPARDAATRATEPRVVVLVDDHDIVAAGGGDPLEGLLAYLPSARDLHLHLVVTRPVAGAGRALFSQTLSATRDTGGATLIMSGDRSEGALVGRTHAEHLPPGRGRYVRRGVPPFLVQVAWAPVRDG